MIPRFKKSRIEPKPIETDYWVDINENEFGGVFKYYDYNNEVWKQIQTITSEKEPKFTNSPAYKITDRDIVDWNSKASYADFDEFKEEVVYAINKIGTIDTSYIESDIQNLKNQLDTKADKNAVPTNQELRRVEDKIPTKVSQLENDSKYITVDEVPELPDSVVSDPNYVHTDNNFTDELKDKLTNLDPDASNYDDTEVRNLIKDNTRLIESNAISIRDNTKNITSNANNIADINSNLNTKANLDDVYTREYLDSLFNTFVRKTHKTYGFCDDRPTDLENEDTGFVFYDYTVNEPIIWVSSEWRILVGNIPLTTIVKDEDILETIGDWEYVKLNDDFCKLTAFIGDKTNEQLDLKVPNLYNTYFALEVGEKDYTNYMYDRGLVTGFDLGWNNTLTAWGDVVERISYQYLLRPEHYYYDVKDSTSLKQLIDQGVTEISNIFQKVVYSLDYDGIKVTQNFSTDKTNINSITFGQGIKKINSFQFANYTLPNENSELRIPNGCNYIGAYAFNNCNISKVEFPVNPIQIPYAAFRNCNFTEVTLPKTLTAEECANGNGALLFADNNASDIKVNLLEGTQAIPVKCFFKSRISNLTLPKSLKYVGSHAFANSYSTIENLDTRNIEYVGDYAFYNNKATVSGGIINLKISSNTKVIMPYAFSYALPVTSSSTKLRKLIIEDGVEYIGTCGIYITSNYCSSDLHIPGTLQEMQNGLLYGYGYKVNAYKSPQNQMPINITIGEGVKCIGTNTFFNVIVGNTELKLPDSLQILCGYAFQHAWQFSNRTIHISKNLKYFGVFYGTLDKVRYDKRAFELYEAHKEPFFSKNGYCCFYQALDYINDGGVVEEYPVDPFYNCFSHTLEEITCDEENPYFKSVDGVLFSKDGRILHKYPNLTLSEDNTYEIPEGVEIIAGNAFARTRSRSQGENVVITRIHPVTGETNVVTLNAPSLPSSEELVPEGKELKNLILPNSYIINTVYEHAKKYLQSQCMSVNELENALYFAGVENFLVKEDNPNYISIDGIIYSKDGTTLIAMPNLKHGNINIPEGVTTIRNDFFSEFTYTLNGTAMTYCISEEAAQMIVENGTAVHTARGASPWGIYLKLPSTLINITDIELMRINAIFGKFNNYIFVDPANPAFTTNETYTQLIRK